MPQPRPAWCWHCGDTVLIPQVGSTAKASSKAFCEGLEICRSSAGVASRSVIGMEPGLQQTACERASCVVAIPCHECAELQEGTLVQKGFASAGLCWAPGSLEFQA